MLGKRGSNLIIVIVCSGNRKKMALEYSLEVGRVHFQSSLCDICVGLLPSTKMSKVEISINSGKWRAIIKFINMSCSKDW